jgi:NADP-dependent 3-hydroxy acid dehydrogenase YdfG
MKTALITGCASGFGNALAATLITKGWSVYATDPRDVKDWDAPMPEGPGEAHIRVLDVTKPDQVAAATADIDTLDLLVNNGGYAVFGTQEETDLAVVQAQFDVNVIGVARVTQAALPALRRAAGTVVQLSSVAGRTVFPESGFYAATKYAVEAMSEALFQECCTFGVKVRLIEPGSFATRFLETAIARSPEPPPISVYAPLRARWMQRKFSMLEAPQDPMLVVNAIIGSLADPSPFLRVPVGPDAERILLTRDLLGADDWSLLAAERNGLEPRTIAPIPDFTSLGKHHRDRLRALERLGHLDHWLDTPEGLAALDALMGDE